MLNKILYRGVIVIWVLSAHMLSTHVMAGSHHAPAKSFKVIDISDQIKMLQGKGGNVGLLTGDQGILLVDDDFEDMSPALKKAISPYGGVNKLTYIINTHWHGDHTEGNKSLGRHATIVAHNNVRTRLLSRQEVKLFGMVSEPYPEKALPSITYKKSMSLHINDEEIKLIHMPEGHTDGDSIVVFKKANVIHMGDHFFNGFYPFVDVDSGGNVLNMAKNIRTILAGIDDKTAVIPGHGPLATKKDLEAFHDMLVGTASEVQKLKDKGKSLEQIQKKGLSEKWDEWGNGFIKPDTWISIVYSSL